MPSLNTRCNWCGHSVDTSGPWEFYRDAQGNFKRYGHPSPISEEARQHGVDGMYGDLYCPNCDTVFKLVIMEFKFP